MSDQQVTCCFTGHRPHRLPWTFQEEDSRCIYFKQQLEQHIQTLYQDGIRHFITGMAQGTDHFFGEAVLALEEYHPDVILECAIPCRSQTMGWKEEEQYRYERLLSQAKLETLVQHDYSQGCMMRRNRYMVDHSSVLIAAYDGNPKGGTAKTIAYAMKQSLQIIIIPLSGKEYL